MAITAGVTPGSRRFDSTSLMAVAADAPQIVTAPLMVIMNVRSTLSRRVPIRYVMPMTRGVEIHDTRNPGKPSLARLCSFTDSNTRAIFT